MTTEPLPLPAHAAAVRRGERDLAAEIDALEARFAEREAEIHAFVPEDGRFERLRRDAAELARRWPTPDARPPLYGVAVGVKDSIHVDGFTTRVGSRLPTEVLQDAESSAVTALRDAGALVLGKTVTTEFTYFQPGPTRNPHNPKHTPGGSSSGSAAAVGAGLTSLALGTQTIGSIGRPAAYCGVVGVKASYGRVPADGAVLLAPSYDHVGFMTRDVADATLVASLLVDDWRSTAADRRPVLGVPEGPYLERADADGLAHFRAICQTLEDAGYELRSVDALDDFNDVHRRHDLVVAAEAAREHTRNDWYPRYAELYQEKTVELIRRGLEVDDDELRVAAAERETLRHELTKRMDEHRLDLWISPPAPGAAPAGLASTGSPVMNLPWTQSGLPSVCVPAGTNEAGLPLGLQLVARFGADETLLAWAGGVEEAVA